MRRDFIALFFAASTAVLGPFTLHYYHKVERLEHEVARLHTLAAPSQH